MLINQEKPALFFAYFSLTYFSLTVLFFEKKSRQKKLWLSGSLCGVLCLPCVRGGGPRSGGRDLRVHAVLLQASPRRVRKPRSGWRDLRVCEARLQASPRRVVKNNPSPPAAELPLHKGAKNTPFQSTRAAGAPFLFDFLSSFFSPRSGLSFLKNAEIFIIFFVGARLSLTTPRFGAII